MASITIVSYTGITQKAIAATLQSDLASASKQIKMFQALSPTSDYPTANNCPTPGVTEVCLKSSGSNAFTGSYAVNNNASPKIFSLNATNSSSTYRVTSDLAPASYTSLAVTDPANWLTVGTQVWAKYNINLGTMIAGTNSQTNNAVLEKYCPNDIESNCTTYGGLYQWDEMMQYVTAEGSQGICPSGSHVPTDTEFKILETYLGMSQSQADGTTWRGTDQGVQLRPGGSSGLNLPLAGFRNNLGAVVNNGVYSYLMSSSESGLNAWQRAVANVETRSYRTWNSKTNGYSVRCIGN